MIICDREDLRELILAESKKTGTGLLSGLLNPEQKILAQSMEEFWNSQDDATTKALDGLLAIVQKNAKAAKGS